MFFLQTGSDIMTGLIFPVILIILHRRDVVAVAVNARILVLGGRMLRISPILNNVFRNVSPLVNVNENNYNEST